VTPNILVITIQIIFVSILVYRDLYRDLYRNLYRDLYHDLYHDMCYQEYNILLVIQIFVSALIWRDNNYL
jgi:hypothetical protein